MGSVGKTALALTVSLMIVSAAAMAAPVPVVKGDPQTWSEIEAALLKLTLVRSYRVKGWYNGFPFEFGLGGAVEIVNPGREHIVLVYDGSFHEGIGVGIEGRSRESSSGDFFWRCGKSTSGYPGPIEFLITLGMSPSVMSEVTAARGRAAVIDSIPTLSYIYTYTDKSSGVWSWPVSHRLFVADATGLPKRIQWFYQQEVVMRGQRFYQEKVLLQADFFDYDAPITIELPACRADQHE